MKTITGQLLTAKADNLILPATGQKKEADDIDLLTLRWPVRCLVVMPVECAMQSFKLFTRKETGELRSSVRSDVPRGV